MGFSEEALLQFFSQYAYQPWLVYGAISFMMLISSFGFPVPEEVTLVSAGLVCYMAQHPDLLPPPPYEGAAMVNTNVAAIVALFAVIFSDSLVYLLGKKFGGRFLRSRLMEKYRSKMDKVSKWTVNYGAWAAGIFRFTPGLRFPGHFACGMLGLSYTKFIFFDGLAAVISVPTQILLIAHFGEYIIKYFQRGKVVIFSLIGVGIVVFLVRYYMDKRALAKGTARKQVSKLEDGSSHPLEKQAESKLR